MSRILIVEDSATQAQQIAFTLKDSGFEVDTAANGVKALKAIEAQMPDLVLTDLQMPEMNGLELVSAIRSRHAALPVVLMTAQGSEEIAVQALQQGAASYVPKRNLTRDLIDTLDHILALARAGRSHQRMLQCLRRAELSFVLDNDCTLIPPVVDRLQQNITHLLALDATERMRVGIALEEALLNALYYGNLEVRTDLATEDPAAYRELVDARLTQAPYQARRIQIDAKVSPEAAVYVIRDEGPGFDVSTLPDQGAPGSFDTLSGRGLLLIRTFMDEVSHNDRGNEITMIKRGGRAEAE